MNKVRSETAIIFILGLLTFGLANSITIGIISSKFLFISNRATVYPVREAVLNFITFGFYGFFWAYKVSKQLEKKDGTGSLALSLILFMPFVRSIGLAYIYFRTCTEVSA
jgi:hypothetical protein